MASVDEGLARSSALPRFKHPIGAPEPPPRVELWEVPPVTDEQRRNAVGLIPANQRPRVILRYADSRELFISGLLDNGDEIAQRPAVVDVPSGNGHVLLFSTSPGYPFTSMAKRRS